MLVTAYYSVEFGKGDGSDTIEWEIELNEEEAAAYRKALAIGEDPTEAPELEDVLCRARDEIIENELEILRETQDEYTLECLGELEEDPGELNELVHGKDPHALAFFGLSEADENDIFSWDANELEKLPLIRDFREDFVPTSPFDEGWSLSVWLEGNEGEAPDEITEECLREALAAGDLEYAEKIIDAQEFIYSGDIYERALQTAAEVGCMEYIIKHPAETEEEN